MIKYSAISDKKFELEKQNRMNDALTEEIGQLKVSPIAHSLVQTFSFSLTPLKSKARLEKIRRESA